MKDSGDVDMDGDKIRGEEISKGAIAVVWVRDAEGLNQEREEKPETRYAELNRTWRLQVTESNSSLGSLTDIYLGSEWR